ncbi:hypothetical protein ElyMa_003706100 [Elysia marginata]|uniref:Uncharacterized protein n=1 Tax=Elysia marginata TaxID=1093978 RepID=A0AAV4F4R1_9GAST|nr:hypothetical protein ElyMa_003706100 [Elysia marginata]
MGNRLLLFLMYGLSKESVSVDQTGMIDHVYQEPKCPVELVTSRCPHAARHRPGFALASSSVRVADDCEDILTLKDRKNILSLS